MAAGEKIKLQRKELIQGKVKRRKVHKNSVKCLKIASFWIIISDFH